MPLWWYHFVYPSFHTLVDCGSIWTIHDNKAYTNVRVQEVAKLREQTMKQTRQVKKLEEKLSKVEGRKRFDPSKAFTPAGKENVAVNPPRSPFRQGTQLLACS